MFLFRFEYHIFYVLYPFVTYLLTLPCIFLKILAIMHTFGHISIYIFTISSSKCIVTASGSAII
jgi:hypothetical protein